MTGVETIAPARMSSKEAARYLRLGENAVRQLFKSGEIAAVRVGEKGGAFRVSVAELDRYIAREEEKARKARGR